MKTKKYIYFYELEETTHLVFSDGERVFKVSSWTEDNVRQKLKIDLVDCLIEHYGDPRVNS